MVTKVEAYKDSSGAIHATPLAAARADAKLALQKIFTGRNNEAFITQVLTNAPAIAEALGQLVLEQSMAGDDELEAMPIAADPDPKPASKWECPHIQTIDIGAGRKRCLACMTVLGEVKADA